MRSAGLPASFDGRPGSTGLAVVVLGVLLLATTIALVGAPSTAGRGHVAVAAGAAGNLPTHGRDATAPRPGTTAAAPRPAAGFTLGSDGATPAGVSLNWSGATICCIGSYTVYYSSNSSSGPWAQASVTAGTSSTDQVGGLNPGGTYWWYVVAHGGWLVPQTQTSNVLSVTQPTLAYLNYTTVTASSVKFTWTNNASYGGNVGFLSYTLYESSGGASPTSVATITSQATRTYTVGGLSSATSYSFHLNTTDCVGGCGTATPTASPTESNTVTFGTPLPLTASIGAQRTVVDVGQPDFFTCTPSGGTSPFSFSWDFGNGTYVAGGSSVSHAFGAATSPTITCLITDHASSRSTAATTVTVNTDPTISFSINRSRADVGQSVGYTCVPGQGTTPYQLYFTFGDGGQANGGPATHSYLTPSQFTATCSAADSTGTQVAMSASVNVSTDARATAAVSAPRAAPGTPLTFTVHPSGGPGGFASYNWSFGDGSSGTGLAPTHAFAHPGNHTVQVLVTDANNGTATTSVSVLVLRLTATVSAPPAAVRTGGSVQFNVNATGGAGGPYNFSWTFGDGATGFGAHPQHTYRAAGTFTPTVTVTDALGATNSTTLSAIQVSVPPPPPPPYAWVSGPLIVAIGLVVALLVAAVGYGLSRRASMRFFEEHAGRVPLTDPQRVFRGAKVCRYCGASNLPIRETCETCGKPLRGLA